MGVVRDPQEPPAAFSLIPVRPRHETGRRDGGEEAEARKKDRIG